MTVLLLLIRVSRLVRVTLTNRRVLLINTPLGVRGVILKSQSFGRRERWRREKVGGATLWVTWRSPRSTHFRRG